MPNKVFISYRREDSKWPASQIYNAFLRVLPPDNVFMDVDSIPPGADFVEILEGEVQQCDVLLALIGPTWIKLIDPKTNLRRLDNPEDFVRVEVRGALARKIPVVPVLLDATEMPTAAELPDDIKALRRRSAEFIDFRTFDTDVQRLIKRLRIGEKIEQVVRDPDPPAGDTSDHKGDIPQPGVPAATREPDPVKVAPLRVWPAVAASLAVIVAILLGARVIERRQLDAPDGQTSAASEALKTSNAARQEAETRLAEASAAQAKAEQAAKSAEKRANDTADELKKIERAWLDAEDRATSAAAARVKAEAMASGAAIARTQADNNRQLAEGRANDVAEALKKSEAARQEAETKLAAAQVKVDELRKIADARPFPGPPQPALGQSVSSPSSSSRTLLADIGGKSRWSIGGTAYCNAVHESSFSLEVGSGSITWVDGLGSKYIETIVSSNEDVFYTKKAASPPAVSAWTRKGAETYAYWRQNNSLFVQPSNGSNFYLERCP